MFRLATALGITLSTTGDHGTGEEAAPFPHYHRPQSNCAQCSEAGAPIETSAFSCVFALLWRLDNPLIHRLPQRITTKTLLGERHSEPSGSGRTEDLNQTGISSCQCHGYTPPPTRTIRAGAAVDRCGYSSLARPP